MILIDDCKDHIGCIKNGIKDIKYKLSKSDNDIYKISLENDLFAYKMSLDFHSNILESLYECNPGHNAIITICYHIIDPEMDEVDHDYYRKLLLDLKSNNRHGISELYFRDELFLSSLISILDNLISNNSNNKTVNINYNIDKVTSIVKKNHKVDDIDVNKIKYIVDIYNMIDILISQ